MKNTQFITTVRKTVSQNEKFTFIILGANCEYRQKNVGPKALTKYNNKLLMHFQVDELKSNYQNSEIIYVSGFEHNKILKNKTNFRIVENTTYFDSGEFEQVRLAIQNSETEKIVILNDTTINLKFPELNKESKVFISDSAVNNPGCTHSKYIEHISYGLKNYITRCYYFTGNELNLLKKYLIENKEKKYKLFTFEIINDLIDKGGKFKTEKMDYTPYENID